MQAQLSLMGRKRGMIHVFDEEGVLVPCSVISLEDNIVSQIKTVEVDGYSAVQLAFGEIVVSDPRTALRRVGKPLSGHMAKFGDKLFKHFREVRVSEDFLGEFSLGQSLGIECFESVSSVDVSGVSKGKGFQGVMKKYGFRGGPASHGSGFHRHAGSTGMRSTPGRCFPGSPRPSHMGANNVTIKNLRVVKVDVSRKVLLVCGAVPGGRGGLVVVRRSKVSGKE
ncbi:50S ribosomal protein L3 [Chlamydiifrater phoenicopteri]|uniref:50S ribosomal protein L3 n=1 Tax=Chlamydiifrater phoenicopteri TaxID=2681469 RepID=UPI001BCD5126|nr:50S ribosomal protein L3 [Chlamydiifrater phoenicopteri]